MKSSKSLKELLKFGILNIDKPSGPTSFWVSDFVREKLGLRKTSHFGTLDPKVTGVLPIASNHACKLIGYFMKKDKTYVGIMRLHDNVELNKLKKEIGKFIGKIKQLPPVRSRVKRQEREREVYKFEILEKKGRDVLFEVKCQAGTYIRKLIHDLGEKIGGAHMAELRRTHAGIFSEKNSIRLYDFEKAVEEYKAGKEQKLREMIIPGEIISKILSVLKVKEKSVKKLLNGSPIHKQDVAGKINVKKGESVAVFCKERFIEIARIVNEGDIIAKPEFVIN